MLILTSIKCKEVIDNLLTSEEKIKIVRKKKAMEWIAFVCFGNFLKKNIYLI